eukprot:CAMPEP_0171042712 /NCGR_PEP_ID=MMETSP0736-20130129/46509_1 /TAXON_ID=186038 /ORGANISM="Fragilariopsis kerguelensis, Strain L26-C5" /LENGTH=74 /DNA_ID=CAMNT_0011491427 /DNA_START=278 /DNA_END=502 /DNA_ORIENTATION=+
MGVLIIDDDDDVDLLCFLFLENISPFACPANVDKAKENPTHKLIPVTLHNVVANAAAANSTPCSLVSLSLSTSL